MKKNTVTRECLAKTIKKETGLGVTKATKVIDDFFDIISEFVTDENDVKLRLFGTFTTKVKKSRVGRNPKTKKEVMIPSRRIIKFKVAPTLKKRINLNVQTFKSLII